MKRVSSRKVVLNELKGRIRAKNHSLRTLAPLVHMGVNTLCFKINGDSDFTSSEIINLCNILDIEYQEITKYFFPQMFPKETSEEKEIC